MATKINDASDFGVMTGAGRQVVRDSSGNLWAVVKDTTNSDLEIWYSTDGSSWAEQDSGDSPAMGGPDLAIAIDSSDVIHVAYEESSGPANSDVYYVTFSSGNWGTPAGITGLTAWDSIYSFDIALDSNDIPHVFCHVYATGPGHDLWYNNRIGGSWSASQEADNIVEGYSVTAIVGIDDIPRAVYYDTGSDELRYAVGDANDPSSFSPGTMDGYAPYTVGETGCSVAADSNGDFWIAYVDSDGYVKLITNDTDWSTGQSVYSSSTTGYEPSLAIDGTDKYVFYQSDDADQKIVYQKYDGSWGGETDLESTASTDYSDVKGRWAYWVDNDSTGALISSSEYYFDASDAGPTDAGGVWSDDSLAYNGNISNYATSTGPNSGDTLSGDGTNAPASGDEIVGVFVRETGYDGNGTAVLKIKDGATELYSLLLPDTYQTTAWAVVTPPAAGWTWSTIQGLTAVIEPTDGSGIVRWYKTDLKVYTRSSSTEIDYLFSDGTDVSWNSFNPAPPLEIKIQPGESGGVEGPKVM